MSSKVSSNLSSSNIANGWGGVGGRIWRHTIGRVSNLARVPIFAVASLFQIGKVTLKTLALPVTYTVVGIRYLATKESYKGSLSLTNIALDGIMTLGLMKSAAICFVKVIIAPSRKDKGIVQGVKNAYKIVAREDESFKYSQHSTLSKIFQAVIFDQLPKK